MYNSFAKKVILFVFPEITLDIIRKYILSIHTLIFNDVTMRLFITIVGWK